MNGRSAVMAVTEPFLVVTPLGLRRDAELADALAMCHVTVVARQTISPWSRASSRLYVRSCEPRAMARAMRFEAQWRALFPDDQAERWELADGEHYLRLVARKAELRSRFRGLPLGGSKSGEPAFSLHAFHVADPCDLAAEGVRIRSFCAAG